jgi:rhomboid protease GluP
MFSENMNTSPVNPVPPIIVILALAVVVPELVLQAAEHGWIGGPEAIGWRNTLIQTFGFFDQLFEHARQAREVSANDLMRLVTYPFVHGSLMHAFFGAVMILALGKRVGEEFSTISVILILLASTVVAPLVYGFFDSPKYPLIGAFPAVYGLLGAYTWILWLELDGKGRARWAAFRLIGFLMVLQLIFLLLVGGNNDWIANLAGFVMGFGLSFLLAPDARPRLQRWLAAIRG